MEFITKIKDRKEIAEHTMSFFFERPQGFEFTAGQYMEVFLIDPPEVDAEGPKRDISIASAPHEKEHLMIATRMRNSAFKNSLKKAALGTEVRIKGPSGSYTLHKNIEKPAVFLAGGIGITPMRSMILEALQEKLPYMLYLFYSNPTPGTTAFLEEFEEWSRTHKNFNFIPTITEGEDTSWRYETGRIDPAMIKKYVSDPHGAIFYASGAPQMVEAMRTVAELAGADPDNIRSEDFAGY